MFLLFYNITEVFQILILLHLGFSHLPKILILLANVHLPLILIDKCEEPQDCAFFDVKKFVANAEPAVGKNIKIKYYTVDTVGDGEIHFRQLLEFLCACHQKVI